MTFDAAERTWTLDREPPFIAEGLRSGTLTQEEVDEWRSLCPSSVGGLAGLSVATACGVEPRVPQVPPAELARQALETVAEKLPGGGGA